VRQIEGGPSEPALIVQGFRQRFGGAEVAQDVLKLPEDNACTVQVTP
jgi:hypothetical protein